MKAAAILLLLCAAVAVHASDDVVMPILSSGTPHSPSKFTGPTRRLQAAPRPARSANRKLLGTDGSGANAFEAMYAGTGGICSGSDNSAYATLNNDFGGYGEIVVNQGLCGLSGGVSVGTVTTSSGSMTYGAAAQDFGAGYGDWETYGWALFQVPARTGYADPGMGVNVEGINIHVITGVGINSEATPVCSLSAVSIAIYDAGTAPNYEPETTPLHMVTVGIPLPNQYTWNGNTSQVIFTDLVDMSGTGGPDRLNLTAGNYYWLRVKMFADYVGTSGTGNGKCFVFWGMRDTATVKKARWQEGAGGAKGYSTTCTGATTSGATFPDNTQTFYNCFNGGAPASGDTALKRRCLSYRTSIIPTLAPADCQAGVNDFNFAIYGNTGLSMTGSP